MSSIKSGLLASLHSASLVFASSLAAALTFRTGLAYQENCIGESVYPTSPDVDTLLARGLIGASSPNNTESPSLTGFTVSVSVGPTTGWFQFTYFAANAIGLDNVGVRGSFENFEIHPTSSDGVAGIDQFFSG